MTKFGQAEFAEFLAEIFVKNKLDEILEKCEKENFSSRNAEDIDEARKICRNLFAIFCGCRFSGEQNGILNKNIASPIWQG